MVHGVERSHFLMETLFEKDFNVFFFRVSSSSRVLIEINGSFLSV